MKKTLSKIQTKSVPQIVSMPAGQIKRKTNSEHKPNGLNRNGRSFENRFELRYKKMPEMPPGLPEPTFSESSNKILQERYLLKGGDLRVIETVAERFWHIAYDIASGDFDFSVPLKQASLPKQVLDLAKEFYTMMVKQEFLPNSPTIMNAGKNNGLQYSACFVLPVGDSIEEIFDSVKYAAMIHKSGGGTGFAFSRLRPGNSIVATTGGVASGPVSFLRVFNAATEAIKQGGSRRGANMGVLRVDHPDILEFIRCKAELDDLNKPIFEKIAPLLPDDAARDFAKTLLLDRQISNFNISVAATDKFMEAVEKGEDYELIEPHSQEVAGKLNAKEVFDEIIERAWKTGDPGLIFIDRVNNSPANPVSKLETIESTNPCITGDTWVQTSKGPRQVYELTGKPFLARINGEDHLSGIEGFFKTGTKELVKLKTVEGYGLRLTNDHLVRRMYLASSETEWVKARDLEAGDYIEINNHRINSQWSGKYTYKEGYLIGLLVGDGTLKSDKAVLSVWDTPKLLAIQPSGAQSMMQFALQSASSLPHRSDFSGWMFLPDQNEYRMALSYVKRLAHELGMYPGRKTITGEIEKASSDFYRGFLRGLFDTDGSVQGYEGRRTSIRLAQSDLLLLQAVQRMLLRLGIFSHIFKNRRKAGKKLLPDGKGGYKEYPVKAHYELSITMDNIEIFNELIGFANTEKSAKLAQKIASHSDRGFYKQKFAARIESIEFEPKDDVYDVKIPGINYYDANGIISHNCGEQPLAPWDACNLGSINLGKFVLSDGSGVDWEKLKTATCFAVHFLDNVVQTNPFTLKQIYDQVHRNRRIGLGVMGFADMLFKLKIPYNSEEALALAGSIMKFINEEGHNKSEELAKERGPFPNWINSIYADKDASAFKNRPNSSAYEGGRPIRNSTITTIAPTGTISIIGDCSSGIEPVFALAYIHKAKAKGDQYRILTIANQTFTNIAQRDGFYTEDLAAKVLEHGSVNGITEVPSEWQKVFVTAQEIDPVWHVKMQAAFQAYTDNGVSKTVNLPNSATRDDVRNVYMMAYQTGCNGITIYRDGSKSTQVLNVSSTLNGKAEDPAAPVAERPMILRGRTYKISTPVGEAFITVNRDVEGQPFEVFVTVGRAGMHTMADAEAMGRLVSLSLRLARGAKETDPKAVALKIVGQLKGIGGASSVGFGKNRVQSLADAIAKVLAEDLSMAPQGENIETIPLNLTIDDHTSVLPTLNADLCPECGSASFVMEEGCKKCHSCGYSMC